MLKRAYDINISSLTKNHFFQRTVTQDVISYMFFFIIAAPDLFKLLQNVGQFAFGKRDLPDPKRFLMVLLYILYILNLQGGCKHYISNMTTVLVTNKLGLLLL